MSLIHLEALARLHHCITAADVLLINKLRLCSDVRKVLQQKGAVITNTLRGATQAAERAEDPHVVFYSPSDAAQVGLIRTS